MEDLGLALELILVGMITVFLILSLVVLIGNLIIGFVNKYLPEKAKQLVLDTGNSTDEISRKKLAALVTAVKIVTKGKGRVTKIEKL